MKQKYIICSFIVLSMLFVSMYLVSFNKTEGFSNNQDITTPGIFPVSVDKAILDDYPLIGKNETSTNTYSQIWWHYPVFSVGSYEQITNNIKNYYNPDNGTCLRADFCGALYHDKKNGVCNIVTPLPPAEEGAGARVGYFRSEPNELYFSIPTNDNILY
jgi:hypothetical protein